MWRRCAWAARLGIVVCALLVAVTTATAQKSRRAVPAVGRWLLPRTPDGRPDLQGFWSNMTATPLQRPREFGAKSHFTRAEAVEYARTWLERLVQEEDEEDRTGADLNEIYLDDRAVVPDLRTSLIVDPPTGRLPTQRSTIPRRGPCPGRSSFHSWRRSSVRSSTPAMRAITRWKACCAARAPMRRRGGNADRPIADLGVIGYGAAEAPAIHSRPIETARASIPGR